MLRRLALLVPLALLAVPAGPAGAGSGLRTDFELEPSKRAGASTGSVTSILYRNPDDPDGKPLPVRRVVVTYPRGTRFNGSVVPRCGATDEQLMAEGGAACPARSRVGSGAVEGATGVPGVDPFLVDVSIFNTPTGVVLVSRDPSSDATVAVNHGTLRGRTLTTEVPMTPGGPPDGETALREVELEVKARSKGRGKRKRFYMRTPRTCPRRGAFVSTARFTYADGFTEKVTSKSPCRRAAGRRGSRR